MASSQQPDRSQPWYRHRAVTVVRVVVGVGAAVVGAIVVLVVAALGHCSAFGGRERVRRRGLLVGCVRHSGGRRDPGLSLSSEHAPPRDRNTRRSTRRIGGRGRGHRVHRRIGEHPGPGGAGTRSLPFSASCSGACRHPKSVATAVWAAGTPVPPWSLSRCRQRRYTSRSARSSVPRRRGFARPTAKRCDGES